MIPAMTDIYTGVLTLNADIWDDLPGHFQRFILLHEQAHLEKVSRSEDQANQWAIEHFIDYSSVEKFEETFTDLMDILNTIQQAPPELQARARAIAQGENMLHTANAYFWQIIMAIVGIGLNEQKKASDRNQAQRLDYGQQIIEQQNQIQTEKESQRQKAILKKMILPLIVAVVLIAIIIFK